jgi:hypothetical protein
VPAQRRAFAGEQTRLKTNKGQCGGGLNGNPRRVAGVGHQSRGDIQGEDRFAAGVKGGNGIGKIARRRTAEAGAK